jgi:hypothetical protein
MASQRMLSTSFWTDNYILELNAHEKLIFIYLLSNPQTNLAGFYELSLKIAAMHTDIEQPEIIKILEKLQADDRLLFKNNWVVLLNFLKHQKLNPSMVKNVEKIVAVAPDWIVNVLKDLRHYRGIDLTTSAHSVPQPVDSLDTSRAQIKETKLKETKYKSKLNALPSTTENAEAAKSQGFDKSKGLDKKVYAAAVRADEEQVARAQAADKRPPVPSDDLDKLFGDD